jgi:hypothetical protein
MKINEYLNLLNLNDNYSDKTIYNLKFDELKRAYHIAALNNHPDKNSDPDSNQKFQDIQNAYTNLKSYINYDTLKDDIIDDNKDEFENNIFSKSYFELIMEFLNILTTNQDNKSIETFKTTCLEYRNKLFEKLLDKLNIEVLEEIYQIINKLHKNNNISHETYKIIFNILKKKFEYVNIYILNPSLENLFKNEIFKLDISGEVVYIPLWHHEVNYNNNIIKIVPLLENNIFIDRDNNIHIDYRTTYDNLIFLLKNYDDPYFELLLNENVLKISLNKLYINKYQTYVFKNSGISQINLNNMFDVSNLSNIIVHIYLDV